MRAEAVAVGMMASWFCSGFAAAQETDNATEFEQARSQLEAAARRMAELSGGAVRPVQEFHRFVDAPAPRAVLGIGIEDDERGVRVVGVTPGGGADVAGVETGDVITAMDGAALQSGQGRSPAEVLVAQMGNVEPGDTVVLTILRDGDERALEVEAQAVREQNFGYAIAPGGPGMGPGLPRFDFTRPIRRWADMELVELSPGLGAYFGAEQGVLVVRAPRDETLGLMDGDVILEIGGRAPMDVGHALRILASFEAGEQLELTIMREQRRRTLRVTIPGPERDTN
jgi:S1-C subfamily serine protease